jgi:hypothetical protein
MNIFALDNDPRLCAQYHCDKHVVKMILEHAQMLSTTARLHDLDVGYKMTHKNHPSTIWVRESRSNYEWLMEMTRYLHSEWQYRYDHQKNHKSFDLILSLPTPDYLPDIGQTPFAMAMPDEYKSDDPVKSYRDYYVNSKKDLLVYTKRKKPNFLLTTTI